MLNFRLAQNDKQVVSDSYALSLDRTFCKKKSEHLNIISGKPQKNKKAVPETLMINTAFFINS